MRELLLLNSRLDKRYDIYKMLGRGSYAEIFAARDTLSAEQSPHRHVAIKALNVFLQDDLDQDLERTLVENFQNEAVALDRVRHPNIISRLGHGTARDMRGTLFHYLVLEYLEGGDLQRLCRESQPDIARSMKYIEQACAGLRHAHRNGIIHRDIKPQNLLLTKDKQTAKIADFGVARIHATDSPITRVGTNMYAAPEHSPLNAGGEVMTVPALTPAADIYSLAKTVYTLVTHESPRFFANQPVTELPLTVRDEEWAEELKRVLNRATQREPSERYQSVDDFWADLEAVRRIASEGETTTRVRPKLHALPQPHVARGYSPIAPSEPRFDTSRDLKLRHQTGSAATAPSVNINELVMPKVPAMAPMQRVEDYWPKPDERTPQVRIEIPNAVDNIIASKPKRTRKILKRLGVFAVLLVLFAGALFATHSFLKNAGIFPEIPILTRAQTGRANTDINLRPEPNVNNQPIGLVTRNSRVRIVKTQNNWYQVDVIEQGRQRDGVESAKQGWLHGKYVDVD